MTSQIQSFQVFVICILVQLLIQLVFANSLLSPHPKNTCENSGKSLDAVLAEYSIKHLAIDCAVNAEKYSDCSSNVFSALTKQSALLYDSM